MSLIKKVRNYSNMRFLKKLREQQGLTQYSMAKKLGMITNTYVHYETKAKGINLAALVTLKRTFNLSWSDLGSLIEKEVEFNKNKKGEI
ncbi:XRE family transcriptional regulator [Candidatus Dependentiae bacterium]|jgi:transcriptional regulator with XRE-family HTH domain|nr:MAG: XRE family transcriptional regulator [Candidatus Dependentiae bacterium]